MKLVIYFQNNFLYSQFFFLNYLARDNALVFVWIRGDGVYPNFTVAKWLSVHIKNAATSQISMPTTVPIWYSDMYEIPHCHRCKIH